MARIILFVAFVILTAPAVAEYARIPDGSGVAQQAVVSPPAPAKHTSQLQGQPADGLFAFWKDYDGPIRTAFLMIAGVAGFGFAFWRARIAERQALTAERGHAIDRFSAAVEQLVSEHLPVRLGGIDALWRIGRESPKEQEETVMGILCAFLREHPHWSNDDAVRLTEASPKVRSDVQAIMHLISDPRAWYRHALPGYILDLRDAVLSGVSLVRADLTGADLWGAKLARAYLRNAVLAGVDLRYAVLENADLGRADLTNANLAHAVLAGADLRGADLTGADLNHAKINHARLNGANFTNANLTNADLLGVKNLSQSQIDSAYITEIVGPPRLDQGLNAPIDICPED